MGISQEEKELAYIYLRKLEIRFENKIEYDDYYLSYSGGKDSHLLYWFIKDYLKTDQIKIISVNTRLEHIEIRRRMYKNSDLVLIPSMKMQDIKKKYGSPCFTKNQDEYIDRYQHGSRSDNTLDRVLSRKPSKHNLNKRARLLTVAGNLHPVSQKCCKYTKKDTLKKFEKASGLKPIIAVRGAESNIRKSAYHTCLDKKKKFSPLFDFPSKAIDAIYKVFDIEQPKLYDYVDRSGCIGCPYINNVQRIEQDLALATPAQRKYIISLWKESYDVKKVNYEQFLKEDVDYVVYKQISLDSIQKGIA